MSTLRLSTLSIIMAMAVVTLGAGVDSWAGPGDCKGKKSERPPECDGDDPGFPTDITVELSGGAFVFDEGDVGVTPDSAFKLVGNDDVHMTRPGPADPNPNCLINDEQTLCRVWNSVFDLCLLLGDPMNVQVPDFPISAGRKGWTVGQNVDDVWVTLRFPLDSPLGPSDPLFTDSMTAGMQLKGTCPEPDCILIPDEIPESAGISTLTVTLDRYAIHLRAKGGVTHAAECHAGNSADNETWTGEAHEITLVITRQLPSP